MLITATQLRVGMLLEMDGALYRAMKMQHITPGNWRGMGQTTLRNLQTGSKLEKLFGSTDKVDRATVAAQHLEFLYAVADPYHFIPPTPSEPTGLSKDLLQHTPPYIGPTMRVPIHLLDGGQSGVTLPMSVELRVVETEPAMRGATAAASMKPATTETGLVVQVSQFVTEGEVVRVDTAEGKYVERVS